MGDGHIARPPRPSGWAGAAFAVVAAFIAISCWWLSQDRGVPFADAGSHLYTVIAYHDLLSGGHLNEFFERSGYYPPATFVMGSLATFVGGVNADAPVVGENLFYVSLLALGCYGTGRLAAGPMAGFLAVLFVLGSPLLIEQMHVFMIDAPLAAVVAVSVWLILLSDRFGRVHVAAAAGAAVGFGLASKEQFPLFIAGLLLVVILRRGGWRNWRGIALFAVVATVIAAPWYLANLTDLDFYAAAAVGDPAHVPARGRPPLLSVGNAGWYFWAVLNGLLFAPLFAFAAVGTARTVRLVAASDRGGVHAARGCGSMVRSCSQASSAAGSRSASRRITTCDTRFRSLSTSACSELPGCRCCDPRPPVAQQWRCSSSLSSQPRSVRRSGPVEAYASRLAAHRSRRTRAQAYRPPTKLPFFSDHDFNLSAPRHADDVLGVLRAMRKQGVTGISWDMSEAPIGDPVLDSRGFRCSHASPG